jgi:hypothetical protein
MHKEFSGSYFKFLNGTVRRKRVLETVLNSSKMAATICVCFSHLHFPHHHNLKLEQILHAVYYQSCRNCLCRYFTLSLYLFLNPFTYHQAYSSSTPTLKHNLKSAQVPVARILARQLMASHLICAPDTKDIFRYRSHHGVNLGGIFFLDRRLFPNMFDSSVAGDSEHDAVIS